VRTHKAIGITVTMVSSISPADEPAGNLNLKTAREIIDLSIGLKEEQGVTIITATHDMKMLDASDRVI